MSGLCPVLLLLDFLGLSGISEKLSAWVGSLLGRPPIGTCRAGQLTLSCGTDFEVCSQHKYSVVSLGPSAFQCRALFCLLSP